MNLFASLWQQGDALSHVLMLLLLLMSVLCWAVIVLRLLDTRHLRQGLSAQLLAPEPRLAPLSPADRQPLLEQVLLARLARLRSASERGLSVLGSIAAVAPFVGLLGTVWGIFHALHRVGVTQQVGLAQIAGPVGEALVMTGIGLAVAIPALLGYNLCLRRNRVLMDCAQVLAHESLIQQCLPQPAGRTEPAAAQPAPAGVWLGAGG